jgi:hypothetical protein
MKAGNRDLLVLVKDGKVNHDQIESEIEQLNSILFGLETVDCFCIAHEVFDVSRRRVLVNRTKIVQLIHHPGLKPFQFILNKN